ncbi:hypothetical protein PPYR_13777 [Photinus pyralis]|uniref:Uncharacterized protein n=1 Tax=Photinus pyralis TaxID=7054 RepID=A0A5N4AA23_PHOPY|nr:hypothetical protein PPYR_13777 [Photinus pyralis]
MRFQKSLWKRNVCQHTKIRHYNTVINPEAPYSSDTLTRCRKGDLENILNEERKILEPKMATKYLLLISQKNNRPGSENPKKIKILPADSIWSIDRIKITLERCK